MILAVNSRTGERHPFPDTPAFVAWFRSTPQPDSLRVVEIGVVSERPAA